MLKAVWTDHNGRTVLMIGLSFGNLDMFRAEPCSTAIKIDGAQMGLPVDIILISGETETDMARLFADKIGPETKFRIDPKLAS